jgi:hypothetical protein
MEEEKEKQLKKFVKYNQETSGEASVIRFTRWRVQRIGKSKFFAKKISPGIHFT